PIVTGIHNQWIRRCSYIEILCVSSVVGVIVYRASVPDTAKSSQLCSSTCCCQHSLRALGRFSNDVDDAVYRIGAPKCCSRAPYHFNPVHILKHDVLHVPIHSREQRCVHAPTIDQHEKLISKTSVRSARTDRPFVLVNTCYLNARHQP